MQAGLLREIIRFQESRTQRDELGGSSDNWVDVFSKRADVRFASGSRTLVNGENLQDKVLQRDTRKNDIHL